MANTKITTNVIADDAVTSDKLGGDLTMPGHVSLADNKELRIGTGNDLVIKHTGSHTVLTNTTGNLVLAGDAVYIANGANSEYLAQFIANGAASLRYDDTEQLATVSGGVYIPNELGIGTNNPGTLLHLYNSSNAQITFQNSSTGSFVGSDGYDITLQGTDIYHILRDTGDQRFYTSGLERMRITSNGSFFYGTTATRTMSGVAPKFFIEGTDYTTSSIGIVINANGVNDCPALFFGKSRGTSDGSNTVVQNGDRLFSMRIDGSDGTNLEQAAIIEAHVDGAVANNSIPGRMTFMTTTAGSQYAVERMRIDSDGHVGIGTTDASDSAWNHGTYGNTEVAIDGGGGYGVLHFRGDGAGSTNTRYSMGVGDDKFYMAYDDVDSRHNITVDGNGHVAFAKNITFANGQGIDFANTSTQTGNTSVSHLFNDYEHGTFTPSHANSITMAVAAGRYVRVGDLVWFGIQIGNSWSNITSAWQFTLDGLPFPVYEAHAAGSCFARYIDDPSNTIVYVTTNEQVHLYSSESGSWDTLYISDLNSVSAYFYIQGTYRTT